MRYVVGFCFNVTGELVVLLEKKKPAWQAGLLNGPGGKVEFAETDRQAMSREFYEETGVRISSAEWSKFAEITLPGACVLFYTARLFDLQAIKTLESEEVGVYQVKDLPANVIPNLRWLIPLALHHGSSLGGTRLQTPVVFYEGKA